MAAKLCNLLLYNRAGTASGHYWCSVQCCFVIFSSSYGFILMNFIINNNVYSVSKINQL